MATEFLLNNLKFPRKINKNEQRWCSFVLGDYHKWNVYEDKRLVQFEHWCGEDNGVEYESAKYIKNDEKWVNQN